MKHLSLLFLSSLLLISACGRPSRDGDKVPVILISDLYYPAQDIGDNVDLLTPYSLDQIDLKAIVMDITRSHLKEDGILRDPGFIPVRQLNYLFGKDVPCAAAPYDSLSSPEDRKEDAPTFQQKGIELLLHTIEEADKPVHIVSTGSLRPLAIALNRRPDLLLSDKVATVHVAAGSSSENFLEWNIALDTLAAARVLRSGMKIILYPCATENGPFDKGVNNAFWALWDLDWILDMSDARLRNYLVYNILRKSDRPDFLSYLENPLPESDAAALRAFRSDRFYGSGGRHYVWETAVWMQVASLVLVEREGVGRIVPEGEVLDDDLVCPEQLWPVRLEVADNGLFRFERCDDASSVRMYFRMEPWKQERLLNEAFPVWYGSFRSVR